MKTRPNTKLSFSSDSVRQETQLWFGALDSVLIQIQKFECMEYKNTIKYGFYFAGERRKSKFAGSDRAVHKFCGWWLW